MARNSDGVPRMTSAIWHSLSFSFACADCQSFHQTPGLHWRGTDAEAFTLPGVLIDSAAYSGMLSAQASDALANWFEEHNTGKTYDQYRLRDW